jgi:hypothetical protein
VAADHRAVVAEAELPGACLGSVRSAGDDDLPVPPNQSREGAHPISWDVVALYGPGLEFAPVPFQLTLTK